MKAQSYYRDITDVDNNRENSTVRLQVNCAGFSKYSAEDEVLGASVRQDYYCFCLLRGKVQIVRPCTAQLEPGQMIIYHPGDWFHYNKAAGEPMDYFWVHFTGRDAAEVLQECGIPCNRPLSLTGEVPLEDLFRRLFQCFYVRDHLFSLQCQERLLALLIACGRAVHQEANPSSAPSQIADAVHYIHTHLHQHLSVAALAENAFLSVSRFHTLFRDSMGMGPQEYILHARIREACTLLRETDLRIGEIAAMVGYMDSRYFSRIFKKYQGVTPMDYRTK